MYKTVNHEIVRFHSRMTWLIPLFSIMNGLFSISRIYGMNLRHQSNENCLCLQIQFLTNTSNEGGGGGGTGMI